VSTPQSTIVLIDEQPLVSRALAARLRVHGFSIRASFRDASQAIAFLRETPADVVLLGLSLRGSGLACLRELGTLSSTMRVVVCNAPGEGDPETALAEGAVAYVEMSGHPDDIVAAIRQATSRSIFFAPPARTVEPAAAARAPLTPRELEVVALVAKGNTNAVIARQLGVTEQAVKFHLSNVYRKLEVSNRTEMSLHAQLRGILPTERSSVAGDPHAS
jgi:DNA-binding NarL/FixJ family response regulator